MAVPQPKLVSLGEAVAYVAARCKVPAEEAKAALDRSFREYSLLVFSDQFDKVQGWQGVEINWESSEVVGGEYLTINGVRYSVKVRVFRGHLDEWIGEASRSADTAIAPTIPLDRNAAPQRTEGAASLFRTGYAGRPTSRHLIESECRRRYETGERHSGKAGESPAEWARVLITWLGEAHPDALVPKAKTLTNTLGGLLRELAAQHLKS